MALNPTGRVETLEDMIAVAQPAAAADADARALIVSQALQGTGRADRGMGTHAVDSVYCGRIH